jgi:UV DNA damage repair endonuclease
MTEKIGFCCKYIDAAEKSVPQYNTKTTTMKWLRDNRDLAHSRLWSIAEHNAKSTFDIVSLVATWPEPLRMMRIGSDLLPGYTEPTWRAWWHEPERQQALAQLFAPIGDVARAADVKLSFHPGQFCCIVSEREEVVHRSVEDLEYHADVARWMGYGRKKLDFKINVHLSGRKGIAGFDYAWNLMSPELRNCLTLENDEYQSSIDDLLPLADRVGIVLDIHHHFIQSGQYIENNDPRITQVKDSWQGQRPTIHYSQSPEAYMWLFLDRRPTMEELMTVTPRGKLRSHSNFYSNKHINEWALSHLHWADIACEAKAKNLASERLYQQKLSPHA